MRAACRADPAVAAGPSRVDRSRAAQPDGALLRRRSGGRVCGLCAARSQSASPPQRRSTPKISNYLAKIRPHVVKLDEHLRPYFGGERASEQLDAVKSALDAADAVQEADIASLPEATQKVYEAKGRVLQDIEDLNRIARNAFEGNADAIALFNKDILLRARQERKKKTE